MSPEALIDLFREGLYLAVFMVIIVVLPGVVVSFFIAMFQAATQINEMSLSFVPKLITTLGVLIIAAPYLSNLMVHFTQKLFALIPLMVN